ncbi:uncharacterized protein LOC133179290 [Saccostrea echinata]|uniref:uncharacterized protein LOC133179290 n=1 Tax=Saccostrea echinata TaxID=191078 RepID=UPI002A813400|nr:uncharacterized protein LOC133179290 [Saccostrea echinata]
MRQHSLVFLVLVIPLLVPLDAWLFWNENSQCPARNGTFPYYFGTSDLRCMVAQPIEHRRSASSRYIWSWTHRFIQYRGKYFDFLGNSEVKISSSRLNGHVCSGHMEKEPAGYSQLSLHCVEGCAKNYPCEYGKYKFVWNNCHQFTNRLSEVLCKSGNRCPLWCLRNCTLEG